MVAIWDHTVAAWSMDQAEAYLRGLEDVLRLLCAHPEMARERFEITPPVRLHPYRAHLVIYRVEAGFLFVVRILHGRQRWRVVLEEG